jgi:hypothetical protein
MSSFSDVCIYLVIYFRNTQQTLHSMEQRPSCEANSSANTTWTLFCCFQAFPVPFLKHPDLITELQIRFRVKNYFLFDNTYFQKFLQLGSSFRFMTVSL